MVYSMGMEDPGAISFAGIGGLSDQIRELREVKATMSSCRRHTENSYRNIRLHKELRESEEKTNDRRLYDIVSVNRSLSCH